MHIESPHGKTALIIAAVVAFASALIVEFQAVEHLAWFRVLKNCGLIFTLIGWFIAWQRVTPYVQLVTRESWGGHPQDDRLTVVTIPAKKHGKGKMPRVDFIRPDGTHFMPAVEFKIEANGDVKLSLSRYSSMGLPDEFRIRIAV